jgi:hypothetical protein
LELRIVNEHAAPGPAPAGLAYDGAHLWNSDYGSGRLYKLSMYDAAVRDSIICPGILGGLAWDGSSLWQVVVDSGWLRQINVERRDFDRTLAPVDAGRLAGLTWDGAQLWVVSQTRGELLAIDPNTGIVNTRIDVPVAGGGLLYVQGSIWLSVAIGMRYDDSSDTFVWNDANRNYALLRIDPTSGAQLGRIAVPSLYLGMVFAESYVWLSDSRNRRLVQAKIVEED